MFYIKKNFSFPKCIEVVKKKATDLKKKKISDRRDRKYRK